MQKRTRQGATAEPAAGGTITHPEGPDDVAVYRLFDAAGELLYVGISKDPMERWLSYRSTTWWPAVARYEWQWYPSRSAAREVEKQVLAADLAEHNVHSTPRHGEHQRQQRAQTSGASALAAQSHD